LFELRFHFFERFHTLCTVSLLIFHSDLHTGASPFQRPE
jgi:hypothetical protein